MLSIPEALNLAYDTSFDPMQWGSLVINKRKPFTDRLFLERDDSRICLHRFAPCSPGDSFAHPHPWPSAMLILAGTYEMAVGHTPDLASDEPADVIRLNLGPGSIYEMTSPHTWHQVIPHTTCYSLMVNGPRWENPHQRAPSTRGKGLEELPMDDLRELLNLFQQLLERYIAPA